jgi:ribonuclease P protein subunit RPR2
LTYPTSLANLTHFRDPGVKRTLCKGCDEVLIPGRTARVRVKSAFYTFKYAQHRSDSIIGSGSHGHIMAYTCMTCKTSLRIPAPPTSEPPEQETPNTMDVDVKDPSTGPQRNKKRKVRARPPPLAARRDAGHVILTGNKSIPLNEENGSGVFIF